MAAILRCEGDVGGDWLWIWGGVAAGQLHTRLTQGASQVFFFSTLEQLGGWKY